MIARPRCARRSTMRRTRSRSSARRTPHTAHGSTRADARSAGRDAPIRARWPPRRQCPPRVRRARRTPFARGRRGRSEGAQRMIRDRLKADHALAGDACGTTGSGSCFTDERACSGAGSDADAPDDVVSDAAAVSGSFGVSAGASVVSVDGRRSADVAASARSPLTCTASGGIAPSREISAGSSTRCSSLILQDCRACTCVSRLIAPIFRQNNRKPGPGISKYGLKSPNSTIPRVKSPFQGPKTAISHGNCQERRFQPVI